MKRRRRRRHELELRFQDDAAWAHKKPIKILSRLSRRLKLKLPYVPHGSDILVRQQKLQEYLQKAKLLRQTNPP